MARDVEEKWQEPHRAQRACDWSQLIFCVWQQQNETVSAQLPRRRSWVPCSQWADFIGLYYWVRLRVAAAVCVWLGNKPDVTVTFIRRSSFFLTLSLVFFLSLSLSFSLSGSLEKPTIPWAKRHEGRTGLVLAHRWCRCIRKNIRPYLKWTGITDKIGLTIISCLPNCFTNWLFAAKWTSWTL